MPAYMPLGQQNVTYVFSKKVTDILAKLKCTSFEMTYVGFLQFKYPAIFAKLYKVWLPLGNL